MSSGRALWFIVRVQAQDFFEFTIEFGPHPKVVVLAPALLVTHHPDSTGGAIALSLAWPHLGTRRRAKHTKETAEP